MTLRLVYLLKKKSKHEFEEYKFHDILDICYDEQSNEVILSSFSPDVLKIESYLLGKRENIKGIDVIIGDNGAGKTTLLKTIQSFLDFSQHKFLSDGLLGIFFDDETRSIFHHSVNIKEEIRVYGSDDVTNSNVTTIEQIELNGYVTEKSIIYITESIDRGDFFELESASVFNGSTGSTMRSLSDEHSENSSITNPIARYFLNETSRQLKFIYFFNEKIKEGGHNFTLPFKLPDSLEIKVDNNNVHRSLVELFSSKNHKDTNAVEKATRKISNKIQDTFILRHKKLTLYTMTYENAMINFLYELLEDLVLKSDEKTLVNTRKKFVSFSNVFSEPDLVDENLFKYMTNLYSEIFDYDTSRKNNVITRYEGTLEWIHDVLYSSMSEDSFEESRYVLSLKNTNLNTFLDLYENISPNPFLNFSWGMSAGERHFLNLFSILLQAKNGRTKEDEKSELKNHIWLLVDEGNASFHPEWQRKYVDWLLQLTSLIFEDERVQIIMTTHSPIILSDTPHHNVTYLKKIDPTEQTSNEKNQVSRTFGQNIYNLFSKSFEVDKVIGSLAEKIFIDIDKNLEKMEEMISKKERVTPLPNDRLNSIQSIVEIIGEEIIRVDFQNRISQIISTPQTNKVRDSIELFSSMSSDEKKLLINYIISSHDKGGGQS